MKISVESIKALARTSFDVHVGPAFKPSANARETLERLPWSMECLAPKRTLHELQESILELSPTHPIGWTAICFEALRRFHPREHQSAKFGEVLISKDWEKVMRESLPNNAGSADTTMQEYVAKTILQSERFRPLVRVEGEWFDSFEPSATAMLLEPHKAIALHDPWRAITAYVLASTAHMIPSAKCALDVIDVANATCPGYDAINEFRLRFYRELGLMDEYMATIDWLNIRPYAPLFYRRLPHDKDAEIEARDYYGSYRWIILKRYLARYPHHYGLTVV